MLYFQSIAISSAAIVLCKAYIYLIVCHEEEIYNLGLVLVEKLNEIKAHLHIPW